MEYKALQPYYKIQREVDRLEQKEVTYERIMYLYEQKIVTEHREFAIGEVFDLSFRKIGSEGGLLYLHTSRGVYSYTVKENPKAFIEIVRNHLLLMQ